MSAARRVMRRRINVAWLCALQRSHDQDKLPVPSVSPLLCDLRQKTPQRRTWPTYRERRHNTPPGGLQGSGTLHYVLYKGADLILSTIRVHRHEPDPNGGEWCGYRIKHRSLPRIIFGYGNLSFNCGLVATSPPPSGTSLPRKGREKTFLLPSLERGGPEEGGVVRAG